MNKPLSLSFGPVDIASFTGINGHVKITAAIGHVCLQWARLEMAVLGVLVAIEGIPTEHGELLFGGMDMLPRVNMAVKLAEHGKMPPPIKRRITQVRSLIQGKGAYDGLAARRNQIVHGAHKDLENGMTTLTMVRWRGEKRDKSFTAVDINELAVELCHLGDEVWSIFEAIGAWKFPDHPGEHDAS